LAKKTIQLSADDMLKAIPYANEAVRLETRKDGSVLASVPLKKPAWVAGPLGWLLPYSSHRRVELDPIGAAVMAMCDGKKKVEEIISEFARENLLSWREAQICVMQFLRQVTERGLVVIVGSSKHESREQ
jgi:hypothetical protein